LKLPLPVLFAQWAITMERDVGLHHTSPPFG
jgi:hypothetical protein